MSANIINLFRKIITNDKTISIYREGLSVALPIGTTSGMCLGLYNSSKTSNSQEIFTNIIGYTTIGIITGIAYPISFPLHLITLASNKEIVF